MKEIYKVLLNLNATTPKGLVVVSTYAISSSPQCSTPWSLMNPLNSAFEANGSMQLAFLTKTTLKNALKGLRVTM